MSFHAFALAAIFAASPAMPSARAEVLADGIGEATDDVDEMLELVATIRHESDFAEDVQDCRRKGDGGRAIALPQLLPHWRGGFSDRDICSTLSLQLQLGMRALRACRGRGTVRHGFARFMGRPEDDPEITRRVRTYERLRAVVAEAEGKPNG